MSRRLGSGKYASVTATLALVVALGGTGYAATKLPRNSVGSSQIKKAGVAGSDIRSNAVTSPKVKNGSLLSKDFKAGQIPAGPKGAPGAPGTPGTKGDAGAIGPSDAFAASRDTGPVVATPGVSTAIATLANLPAGSYAVVAKIELHASANTDVLCTLTAGTNTDVSESFVGPSGASGAAFVDVLSFALVHTFAAAGQVQLTCTHDLASTVTYSNTKIVATRVGSASGTAVTG
jgi:hypothetical protein